MKVCPPVLSVSSERYGYRPRARDQAQGQTLSNRALELPRACVCGDVVCVVRVVRYPLFRQFFILGELFNIFDVKSLTVLLRVH